MARLYLFAEGMTEQTFARNVLGPHLADHGVYIQGPIVISHVRKKGREHRGGGRRYGPMKRDIERKLKQEKGPDVFFTTMIDLYGLHADFPGVAEADKLRHMPLARAKRLEEAFAEDMGDGRFIPYIQLHEFEAILFTDPSAFGTYYSRREREIRELREIRDREKSPEDIDDGQHSAPSKRIARVLPDFAGAKPTAGPQIAQAIGLGRIRESCGHFGAWLARLEKLG